MYQIGDKVLIISKSTGQTLDEYWRSATRRAQYEKKGYAVVQGIDHYEGTRRYNVNENGYFLASDLMPYKVEPEQAFELLVKGRITEKHYTNITRTTQSEV